MANGKSEREKVREKARVIVFFVNLKHFGFLNCKSKTSKRFKCMRGCLVSKTFEDALHKNKQTNKQTNKDLKTFLTSQKIDFKMAL